MPAVGARRLRRAGRAAAAGAVGSHADCGEHGGPYPGIAMIRVLGRGVAAASGPIGAAGTVRLRSGTLLIGCRGRAQEGQQA